MSSAPGWQSSPHGPRRLSRWDLRQVLTGDLPETVVEHTHREEYTRQQTYCAMGGRLLMVQVHVSRPVEPMVW